MDSPATPSSYPRQALPVSGQPGGYAGVVPDAMVSNWHHDVPHARRLICHFF